MHIWSTEKDIVINQYLSSLSQKMLDLKATRKTRKWLQARGR